MAAALPAGWRLELFIKSKKDLVAIIPFLRQHGIKRINLPNKRDDFSEDLSGSVRTLKTELPDVDICVHFSCKNQWRGEPAAGVTALKQLMSQIAAPASHPIHEHHSDSSPSANKHPHKKRRSTNPEPIADSIDKQQSNSDHRMQTVQASQQESHSQVQSQPTAIQANSQAGHILLVSGGRKRKQFDTISVLKELRNSPTPVPVFCAFNPFIPKPPDLETEKQRLDAKLSTGMVAGIYLQIGTDLDALRSGVDYLRTCIQKHGMSWAAPTADGCDLDKKAIQVYGSVLLPTKKLLAQFKFRPWNGVYLSEEYLSSVEAADKITRQVVREYAALGITPLVESAVETEEQLKYMIDILSEHRR